MIKLETTATYYKKSDFLKSTIVEKETFQNMQDALQAFQRKKPRYYINKKDISIIETISLFYKIDLDYKRLYKTIDPSTEEIETNYKKEV